MIKFFATKRFGHFDVASLSLTLVFLMQEMYFPAAIALVAGSAASTALDSIFLNSKNKDN